MIPKRVIQIYQNHNLPMVYKISQEIIMEKCESYTYKLYTNKNMKEFIEEFYPQYLDLYNNLLEPHKNFLFILLELYTYGGIYLDFDVILHKSFDELIDNDCCIMPLSQNDSIDKYCIITNKKNKFIFYLILQISQKYNTNKNFITNKIIYNLHVNYKNYLKVIYGDYNCCFGNFLYNIKLHSKDKKNNYPDYFKNTIYDNNTKKEIKTTLLDDLKWLTNINYNFL